MTAPGQPLNPDALRQAADWFAQLQAEDIRPDNHLPLLAWRRADPVHEQAWQRVEQLAQLFDGIPPRIGAATLARTGVSRRKLLRNSLGIAAAGGLGWWEYDSQSARLGWGADLATGVGEQQPLRLADGSRVLLNTDSAVDVGFDSSRRRIELLRGEILIETAKDSRPFSVVTPFGPIAALGTRFTVRLKPAATQVAVFDGAVELHPARRGGALLLEAGAQGEFTATQARPAGSAQGLDAWSRGLLVANNQRLGAVVSELARYHRGLLRCDPAAAALRLSAVLPITSVDAALGAIANALPVRIARFTRYWVQIESR